MATWPFTAFRIRTAYPDNATRVKFGRGYTATAQSNSPDERMFTLKLKGFKYYLTGGGALDITTNATLNNVGNLQAFYQTHGTWKAFDFPHPDPSIGTISCRFDKPLDLPEGIEGADGMLPEFEVKFIEVP